MKVVMLSARDRGGAYTAARRLAEALRKESIGVKFLVADKLHENSETEQVITNPVKYFIYRIIRMMNNYKISAVSKNALGKFSADVIGLNIAQRQELLDADVIHIHWPHGGMLGTKDLIKLLTLNKPIVWTMHDMWAVTGGCFYTYGCRQFVNGCQNCPLFADKNVSRYQKGKRIFFSNHLVHLVGCSSWITREAQKSLTVSNGGNNPIHIMNCLNTDIFRPHRKEEARKQLGIKSDKKIVLFGASSSNSDTRKGFDLLLKAIQKLDAEKYLLLVFGNSDLVDLPEHYTIAGLGHINEEDKLAAVYSAADVFVAPSREENLANTVVEAQSCGLPVVAFNIGGMPDMIQSGVNGYLANAFDTDELAKGIEVCCTMDIKARNVIREKAVSLYSFHTAQVIIWKCTIK